MKLASWLAIAMLQATAAFGGPAYADTPPAQRDALVAYMDAGRATGCALKTFDLVTGAETTLKSLVTGSCDSERYFSEKTGDLALVEDGRLEIIHVRSGKDTLAPTALPIPPLDRADMKNNYAYLTYAGMDGAGKPMANYADTETGNRESCVLYAFDGHGWSLVGDTDCAVAQYGFTLSEGSDAHQPWKIDKGDPWFVSNTETNTGGCNEQDMGDAAVHSAGVFHFTGGDSRLDVDRSYGCGGDDPLPEVTRVALTPASDPHERVIAHSGCGPEIYGRYLMVCAEGWGRVYDLESGRLLFEKAVLDMVVMP